MTGLAQCSTAEPPTAPCPRGGTWKHNNLIHPNFARKRPSSGETRRHLRSCPAQVLAIRSLRFRHRSRCNNSARRCPSTRKPRQASVRTRHTSAYASFRSPQSGRIANAPPLGLVPPTRGASTVVHQARNVATVPTGRRIAPKASKPPAAAPVGRWLRDRSRSRLHRERLMPSTPFLDDAGTDPEVRRVVGVAFEMTRIALSLAERPAVTNEIIAKRIIELAKTGERNPDILCEGVLKEFRERRL